jgi:predicted transcriptional regulator
MSRGESGVARIVSVLGEATLGQVFEACLKERQIDYTTVQTYLRRLEAKGYLRTRRDGRTKLYSPAVTPGKVILQTVRDLFNRLCGGSRDPLVRNFKGEVGKDFTLDDINEFRELLDRLEEELE